MAVQEAMRITRRIQAELTGGETLTKKDKSPVTIADFASQAIICRILKNHFPQIPIVGEERAEELRKPENQDIYNKVVYYITGDPAVRQQLTAETILESIDLGGGKPNPDLFWTLDPVDGTKGFLRGEQYAIALALISGGQVVLGILGCPNLFLPDRDGVGYLLWAKKGEKARMRGVASNHDEPARVSAIVDAGKMRFVESYEAAHSDQETQGVIARDLRIAGEPVRMDSQVKYAVLAAGYAEIYLRIPNPHTPDYKEKIWDHAAGSIIVTEAGGCVSDVRGEPLDFSRGVTLTFNAGICAAVPAIHGHMISRIAALKGDGA